MAPRSAVAASADSQSIRGLARVAWGMEALALSGCDDLVATEATSEALAYAAKVAPLPARSVGETALKLALLVQSLAGVGLGELDGTAGVQLLLAAGALADLTVLGAGAIDLPRDAADVARLHARAGRLS